MRYRELTILLPCHSLEDFPLYHVGQDADSLLACWTALWHPSLMAAADSAPRWHRIDLPPEDLQEMLILVPTVSMSQLPTGFAQRAKDAGALLLRGEHDRNAILATALEKLDSTAPGIDEELVADFLAIGFAYLQVQVLTRQMRYASNLDEVHFFNQLLVGAKAAQKGEVDEARSKLSACFDLLAEERDHYYSVDAYLLDLTLLADQTLGLEFRKELAGTNPINLLLSARLAELTKQQDAVAHSELIAAIQEGRVGLVGGEYDERRLPLLSCEGVLAGFRHASKVYQDAVGRCPEVYGRRSFGLTPFLPQVLEKLRFRGSIHATMDDGQFPSGSQIKTRWQGVDGSVIDAIAKPPLDASKPETFLSYAQKLGESMDMDHVATLCLAHWPGHTCPWYEDLRRCARYTSALGKFVTVERYFTDTYLPGHLDRFGPDQYKSPYLRQDVIRKQTDPISWSVRYWRHRVAADVALSVGTLATTVANLPQSVENLADKLVEGSAGIKENSDADQQLAAELSRYQRRLAEVLPRQNASAQLGYLLVNPFNVARRIGVDVSDLPSLPAVEKPVYMVDQVEERKLAVVEVPPMGFAWIAGGNGKARRKRDEPLLAEDARADAGIVWLRNEFLEAAINTVTGSLQAVTDYKSRGNRLSQQLALRTPGERGRPGDTWRDPDELANYSVMAADEIRVLTASSALGEVEARGRLLNTDGQVLANYRQVFRLWRGSRVIQLEIELDPIAEPSPDPWNSYYACRFAWSDEDAEIFQAVNQTRHAVTKRRLDSPLYIEVESGERRTTILTGGLPYHRCVGSRMLDSILVVRGERARSFRMGVGLDLGQSLHEAIGLLAPATVTREEAAPPVPTNCWLFSIDNRAISATHWSPLVDGEKLVGIRARLLECTGKTVRAKLSAYRAFTAARQVNFLGETVSELLVQDGKVVFDVTAHEWIELEARWN